MSFLLHHVWRHLSLPGPVSVDAKFDFKVGLHTSQRCLLKDPGSSATRVSRLLVSKGHSPLKGGAA